MLGGRRAGAALYGWMCSRAWRAGGRPGRGGRVSGLPGCPAGSVVAGAEDGEPGPVDGAGAGVKVGADAGQPAGAGFAAAPGPAGEVGDLPLDDGPFGPVTVLPGRFLLLLRARCSTSSSGWMAMVRPRRAAVHADRSGQAAHQGRNDAVPPPRAAAVMMAVCPAGQVTVPRSRSTPKRSLANRPAALRAGGHLAMTVNPCSSRPARVAAPP